MKPFELLEHTADAKFRAHGKTLEEAFANAVRALAAIATDKSVEHERSLPISVTAKDLQGLLFALIDEVIYRIDTEGLLPAAIEDVNVLQEGESYTLTGTLVGDEAKRYGCNLKAATYSEMLAEEKSGIWTLQAVVDI